MSYKIVQDTHQNLISVHGRSSLKIPFTRYSVSSSGVETKIDVSDCEIFMEVPAVGLRRQLIVNPDDPEGLLIYLSRTDVGKLLTTPIQFAIIDETDGEEFAELDWEGMIVRSGYVGEPDE